MTTTAEVTSLERPKTLFLVGDSTPANLQTGVTEEGVFIGDEMLSLEAFVEMVKNAMTASDLVPGDPRVGLIRFISNLKMTAGYNPEARRLVFR